MFLNKLYILLLVPFIVQCANIEKNISDGVFIREIDGEHVVFKNGKEFEIRGVSGNTYLKEAKEVGATVIRTWHEENAQAILDSAFKYELHVILGIYIPEPRNGYDYSSEEFINTQKNRITIIVNKYKNHPALLFWAVGNEVEYYPSRFIVWRQLNNFIKLVKTIDNKHPVTSAINPDQMCIRYSKIFLRDMDILSINAFGEIGEVAEKLNMSMLGWDGPTMITEWGTNGAWEELEKTTWGAPIEKNSTTKAEIIRNRYNDIFLSSDCRYMGNFIFYWGHRHEYTNTWFSIFSEHGDKSEIFYEMKSLWNNSSEQNLPPKVKGIFINKKSAYDDIILKSNENYSASVNVEDSDSLRFSWKIVMDNIFIKESDFLIASDNKKEKIDFILSENSVSFDLNLKNGPYRLYVDIYDGNNNYGYANIPFYVLD